MSSKTGLKTTFLFKKRYVTICLDNAL